MLQRKQFHEMSREEFESQPGTYFHGNPTGNFNWEQPRAHYGFHVGTKQAATDAVVARAGTEGSLVTYSGGQKGGPAFPGRYDPVDDPERPYVRRQAVAHPEHLRGGRIVSDMVNSPGYMGSYGRDTGGDMVGSGDVLANARAASIHGRGQTMRRGIYYRNVAEDTGSISAVLPSRQSWKTHEDYLVEARARGAKIPTEALKGYREIPGQQRLF